SRPRSAVAAGGGVAAVGRWRVHAGRRGHLDTAVLRSARGGDGAFDDRHDRVDLGGEAHRARCWTLRHDALRLLRPTPGRARGADVVVDPEVPAGYGPAGAARARRGSRELAGTSAVAPAAVDHLRQRVLLRGRARAPSA